MWQLLREWLAFTREEGRWWLLPLILFLLALGALLAFSSSPILGPLIYPFM